MVSQEIKGWLRNGSEKQGNKQSTSVCPTISQAIFKMEDIENFYTLTIVGISANNKLHSFSYKRTLWFKSCVALSDHSILPWFEAPLHQ